MGMLKSCIAVQFWGGKRNILRVILGIKQECFYTTLALYIHDSRLLLSPSFLPLFLPSSAIRPPCMSRLERKLALLVFCYLVSSFIIR